MTLHPQPPMGPSSHQRPLKENECLLTSKHSLLKLLYFIQRDPLGINSLASALLNLALVVSSLLIFFTL